jgi:zinc transporter ZupT
VAIGAYLLEGTNYAPLSGFLLGLSAGTFLYIAACDLLPQLHRTGDDKWPRLALFLLGAGMSVAGSLVGGLHAH